MFKIRKKDKVMVRTGKDKGKMGEVLMVFPDKGRVIVSKANMVKKHQRPTSRRNRREGMPGLHIQCQPSLSPLR